MDATENDPDATVWDRRVDVIVVGTGAAGLAAAIAAHDGGAEVLVLEKADMIGGTTGVSGGMPWVPCNRHMAEVGVGDSVKRLWPTSPGSPSGASPTLRWSSATWTRRPRSSTIWRRTPHFDCPLRPRSAITSPIRSAANRAGAHSSPSRSTPGASWASGPPG